MATLLVPPLEEPPLPTLGFQLKDFIEDRCIYGPGMLAGQRAQVDPEKFAVLCRMYEVWPQGHPRAGYRRFRRVGISWLKGSAKTEFAAWIAFCELHPEAPARCDGFDANGEPVGRPVSSPFIPMVAFTQEQSSSLAFGRLLYVISEGPDADFFDVGMDRVIRLGRNGQADGKAVPLASSPNARDGAITTHQQFEESHRLYLRSLLDAHETMLGNLLKPTDDAWSLEITTAGQPGQGSVAEKTHREAEAISRGELRAPELFYFHRQASDHHDLTVHEDRVAAITEAAGPNADRYDIEGAANQWERPGADKTYLERVWTNRWTLQSAQAFDPVSYTALGSPKLRIPDGAFVTLGFDGARFFDSTAFVLTDVATGVQELGGLWERPLDVEEWEVPVTEVSEVFLDLASRFQVWKLYADPAHWVETVGSWSAAYPDVVREWWTNRPKQMAQAVADFRDAIDTGDVAHNDDPDLVRHVGNAGRKELPYMRDDQGQPMFILQKLHEDRKFDAAMAAVLSWRARLDAISSGAQPVKKVSRVPFRIR